MNNENALILNDIFFNNIEECSNDINEILLSKKDDELFINNSLESIKKSVSLSVVIMTFNEERCISRCIKSIENIADEIIIIDTGSTDKTIDIISSKFPAVKLFMRSWENDFSYIRNELINLSSCDWIFQIDADEFLELNDQIVLKNFINIIDTLDIEPKVISPKIIDHTKREYFITKRIFKRTSDFKYFGMVHEELRYKNATIKNYIIPNVKLYHDGYMENIIISKDKYNRNVHLLKKMIEIEPENIRWYYFLARDSIFLKMPKDYIKSILLKGLNYSYDDPENFKIGILIKLMELDFENTDCFYQYLEQCKEHNSNCMDRYYFDLLKRYMNMITHLASINSSSIKKVSNIEDSFSLINNNADHLFSLWGWVYFTTRNYDLAFSMFKKLKCTEDINLVIKDLSIIKHKIDDILNFYYLKS
ncbi:Glycosyltransferase involved in cell wall bisynthesis [Clostridium cavendishii DSM 21758]|uniref:Glycosyltransferase involved in cell wall bisynthesis n=1 Tax=Clostridium cavendishii DSM 21758 TaxID=1121302 RepID=A0A1M6PQP4_9CLOT|nr:glycosyltransferase [Clostridium cavendishii]SHK10201.1 Glycosyltransferase involved in cell wall bisynthesis [Clostridium cavendishii DSM 21758]